MIILDFSLPPGQLLSSISQDNLADWELVIVDFVSLWLDHAVNEFTIHTSGSTGVPKVIFHSRTAMTYSATRTCDCLHLKREAIALLAIPAQYIGGRMMIVRAAVLGMKLVCIVPKANPLLRLDCDLLFDFAAFTPMQMSSMLADETTILSVSKITTIVMGGGEVSNKLKEQITLLPCAVYETYGMTETVSHIALKRLNGNEATDFFTAMDGVKFAKSVDGCLIIYDSVRSNIPLLTCDMVELIDDRRFQWLGRADWVINTGGIKINPEVVEGKLRIYITTPFFIHGERDSTMGQRVVMVIEGEPLTDVVMIAYFQLFERILDRYERPKQIYNRDSFKYSPSGKLLRKESYESVE